MTSRNIVCVMIIIWSAVSCAVGIWDEPSQEELLKMRARRQQRIEKEGGLIRVSGKGSLVAIDLRQNPDLVMVEKAAEELKRSLRIAFTAKSYRMNFAIERIPSLCATVGGQANVFIIDDPLLPMALTAQEDRWALVNVAKLRAGDPSEETFCKRFKLAFFRASTRVLGGDSSRFATACLFPVVEVADLDKINGCDIAFDVHQNIVEYMPKIGIERIEFETYKSACEGGIAPPPTNDLQRAIWKQTHEIPTEPITIKKNK